MRARLSAHTRWAHTEDSRAATATGREAFAGRFEREVDPAGVLPPEERAVRAEQALKAYMLSLGPKRRRRV
jgi:hypothetical protein